MSPERYEMLLHPLNKNENCENRTSEEQIKKIKELFKIKYMATKIIFRKYFLKD